MAEEQWKGLARTVSFPLNEAWHSLDLANSTADLGETSRTLARFVELTDRVVRVFSLYGSAHLAVLTDGPLWQDTLAMRYPNPSWQSWVQSRDAVYQRTVQPLERLRTVGAYHLANADALAVAESFPEGSQGRFAWMQASENLETVRQGEPTEALLNDTAQMRTAVSGLLVNGFLILDV